MYRGVNAVPLENYEPRGPQPFATLGASLYFVIFMVFVSSFLLSLFSGFVIVVFQEVGFKSYRQAKLDRNQVRETTAHNLISMIEINIHLFFSETAYTIP